MHTVQSTQLSESGNLDGLNLTHHKDTFKPIYIYAWLNREYVHDPGPVMMTSAKQGCEWCGQRVIIRAPRAPSCPASNTLCWGQPALLHCNAHQSEKYQQVQKVPLSINMYQPKYQKCTPHRSTTLAQSAKLHGTHISTIWWWSI